MAKKQRQVKPKAKKPTEAQIRYAMDMALARKLRKWFMTD